MTPERTSVEFELVEGLLTITLNEPESRNALTPGIEAGLVKGTSMAADPAVRAVLLTARGSAFCGGGNLREMESNDLVNSEHVRSRAAFLPTHVWRPLYELPKPVIAAVNGWAVGAGIALALAADLRVASDRARFRLGFSRVGLSPDMASAWTLPRTIGLAASLEWMLTDRVIAADEALALGLVHRVAAHDDLVIAASVLGKELAAGPTLAFGATKRLMKQSFEVSLDTAISDEAETQVRLLQTHDHREGLRAIRSGEPPRFEGR